MPWKHFTEDELRCKHCGKIAMDEKFMAELEQARTMADLPFPVNSGYRCLWYDASIGGDGNHPQGKAIDIWAATSPARWIIISALIRAGFKRIGIAKGFIHADTCEDKPQGVIWLYP